jgi:hypothetical protein
MADDTEDTAGRTTTDPSAVDPSTEEQTSQQATVLPTDGDLLASDLMHAAHVLPPDMVANVELTLDHLSTTIDLFDVPPFDFGDSGGDGG